MVVRVAVVGELRLQPYQKLTLLAVVVAAVVALALAAAVQLLLLLRVVEELLVEVAVVVGVGALLLDNGRAPRHEEKQQYSIIFRFDLSGQNCICSHSFRSV